VKIVSLMEGYAKVAELMGRHPELAIIRKFKTANLQNLLYMQAEITYIEEELRQIETRDIRHGQPRESFAHDWWFLANAETAEDSEQWSKVLELRKSLEQYSKLCLSEDSQGLSMADRSVVDLLAVMRMAPPVPHDLDFIRKWFKRPSMGAHPLLGTDRGSWDTQNEGDLGALIPRRAHDRFSQWFIDSLVPKLHKIFHRKYKVYMVSSTSSHCVSHYVDSKQYPAI
jgi:hypothetical protein